MDYVFILGRDYELSLLEILYYFSDRNINFKIKKKSKEYILAEVEELNFKDVIKELGGVVKIGKIIDNFDNLYSGSKSKLRYGISCYGNKEVKDNIKDYFKKEKIKALHHKSNEKVLMPSESIKLDIEILVFEDFIAKAVAIFNPKEYKFRDKRPFLDEKKVISIRLAKILINLSGVMENETLLDPFCGVGTVLQEALLRNINVNGVDIDKKSVEECIKNLEWLKENYNFEAKFRVVKGDSRKISSLVRNIDGVATEPYLGPYLKRRLTYEEAKKIVKELEELYLDFLKSLRKVLTGRVVIIIPVFKTNTGKIGINFENIMKKTGFKLDNMFKEVKLPISYETEKRLLRKIYVLI